MFKRGVVFSNYVRDMADNLITCIEFLGLPGSGKSFFSHIVAEKLREGGLDIIEPSWTLDNSCDKYSRVIRKSIMALCYTITHYNKANKLKKIIRNCGYRGSEAQRFKRNILYKAYLFSKKQKSVLMFDEGMSQMAVSLSANGMRFAREIYDEMDHILELSTRTLCIRIDCDINDALINMSKRVSNDSRVEKLSDLESKQKMLLRFKQELESIETAKLHSVRFSYVADTVISTIIEFIKKSIIQ